MCHRALVPVLLAVVWLAPAARAEQAATQISRTSRPPDAKLYLISPAAGAAVSNPVTIRFGLAGMGIAPAGVAAANAGHHHLIIDAPVPPPGAPIPKDDHYRHFGGGQTEVTLDLAPGEHTLQLELGDKDHVPFEPPLVSDLVKIRVK